MSRARQRQGFLRQDEESWYAGCTCGAKMRPDEDLDGGARLACEAGECEKTMMAFSEVLDQ